MTNNVKELFSLSGKTALITGGTGFLGKKHAEALLEYGATPILLDIKGSTEHSLAFEFIEVDITKPQELKKAKDTVLSRYKKIDILINNATNNPKVGQQKSDLTSQLEKRLEFFPLETWNADLAVGLTGAFLCSQIFGAEMARVGSGVILNIASDLALIGPDQRIYKKTGLPEYDQDGKATKYKEIKQNVKPVSYSVVKSGLIGLTRYLATYWAHRNVRVNALCPGGVYENQPADFVERLTNLIPLGRMANPDEYKAAIVFLCSDASSYMTGSILSIDGGRTCW